MPRPVTTRSVKSVQGWASKSDQLARASTPFAPDAVDRDAEGHARVAVAANLHKVVGLQAFTLTPQAAANLEVDDALFLPVV